MLDDNLPLKDLPAKAGDGDFLLGIAVGRPQARMAADVEGMIGAVPHGRSGKWLKHRNGDEAETLTGRGAAFRRSLQHPAKEGHAIANGRGDMPPVGGGLNR